MPGIDNLGLSRIQFAAYLSLAVLIGAAGFHFSALDDKPALSSAPSPEPITSNNPPEIDTGLNSPNISASANTTDFLHSSIENEGHDNIETIMRQSESLNPQEPTNPDQIDEDTRLNLADIADNTLAPLFLAGEPGEYASRDQKAAIRVFTSQLPDDLNDNALQEIHDLLRASLPYDTADALFEEVQLIYRQNELERELLSGTPAPETMAQQIAMAERLERLRSADADIAPQGTQDVQDVQDESEQSAAWQEWQVTEARLAEIQSGTEETETEIRSVLEAQYNPQVADDLIALSESEKQWQEKYQHFLSEKQVITRSGLSEEDKAEQIESLIRQHYEENEWAAVRGYDQIMQAQSESEG